jgi:hypothetical protein
MAWPSGDHRGEYIPTDPGRVVTRLLSSSRMQMTLFGSSPASLLVVAFALVRIRSSERPAGMGDTEGITEAAEIEVVM